VWLVISGAQNKLQSRPGYFEKLLQDHEGQTNRFSQIIENVCDVFLSRIDIRKGFA